MILGGERERTKGSPLTRMDQLRRICLSRYSEYPQYFPVQEQVLFTIHNILQRILVDQDLCPDLQQRDRYSRDFRLNRRGLRSTPTECVTYGAKSNMSNRYFDWTRNCFKHMIFKRTFEFFEELAIKMKKKKKCDTIYKISLSIFVCRIQKCLEKKKRKNTLFLVCYNQFQFYDPNSLDWTDQTDWIGQILPQIPFLQIPLKRKGKEEAIHHTSQEFPIPDS